MNILTLDQAKGSYPVVGDVIFVSDLRRVFECVSDAALTADDNYFLITGGGTPIFWKAINDLFIIKDDGEIYFLDNVGIGINNPTSRLHVRGTDDRLVTVEKNGNDAALMYFFNSTTGTTDSDGFLVGLGAGENGFVFNRENNAVNFGTNNLLRIILEASGEFNIQTGNSIQHNGTDLYGYLESPAKTPIFAKWLSGSISTKTATIAHGIANAYSDVGGKRILGIIPWLDNGVDLMHTVRDIGADRIEHSEYDNTNVYITRSSSTGTYDVYVLVMYR